MKSKKCETCDSLRNIIEDLHETLSKFTMIRDNHNTILSNQKTSYNKANLTSNPLLYAMVERKRFILFINAILF